MEPTGTPGPRLLLVPEGVVSSDGRVFTESTWRTPPLPLMLQRTSPEIDGHGGAELAGALTDIERGDDGGIYAVAVFDTASEPGSEAARLVADRMLTGVSIDAVGGEVLADGDTVVIRGAEILGATLTPHPAFADAGLVASGPGARLTDYQQPTTSVPIPLTVTDDGRIYGHAWTWETAHISYPGREIRAPRSEAGHPWYRTGYVSVEGTEIPTGPVTIGGGHPDERLGMAAALDRYADASAAVADVASGEDEFGGWIAGRLREGVTPAQIAALRASSLSGDWRPIRGRLELVAIHAVNTPGFPICRSLVADGRELALVASGPSPRGIATTEQRLLALEHRAALARLSG